MVFSLGRLFYRSTLYIYTTIPATLVYLGYLVAAAAADDDDDSRWMPYTNDIVINLAKLSE